MVRATTSSPHQPQAVRASEPAMDRGPIALGEAATHTLHLSPCLQANKAYTGQGSLHTDNCIFVYMIISVQAAYISSICHFQQQ